MKPSIYKRSRTGRYYRIVGNSEVHTVVLVKSEGNVTVVSYEFIKGGPNVEKFIHLLHTDKHMYSDCDREDFLKALENLCNRITEIKEFNFKD